VLKLVLKIPAQLTVAWPHKGKGTRALEGEENPFAHWPSAKSITGITLQKAAPNKDLENKQCNVCTQSGGAQRWVELYINPRDRSDTEPVITAARAEKTCRIRLLLSCPWRRRVCEFDPGVYRFDPTLEASASS